MSVELPESVGYRVKKRLLGPPLHTERLADERLGKPTALAVFASDDPAAPQMLGAYQQEGDRVVFRPRFPPTPQVRLRAVFRPAGRPPVTAWFDGGPVPEPGPATRLV